MVPYVYQPLERPDQQIRLLDLFPAQSGLIECKLRSESLDGSTSGSYEALSYCWGSPTASKVCILVDGSSFFVTPNLHAALLRLRSASPSKSRTVWIDAICIDQGNIREKNSQIPLMSQIYSSCQRVVVWLGEHDLLTKSAI